MTIRKFFLSAFALVALALAPYTAAEPASVIMDTGCGIPLPDGGFLFVEDAKIVSTNSANGNRTLNCKFDGAPNESGQAIRANGNQLGVRGCVIALSPAGPFCLTSNWNYLVSAGGQASLTCHCTEEDNL